MRLCSGTLLALLAWAVIIPGSAIAGCSSHFVPTVSLSGESGTSLESLDRAGELAIAEIGKIPGRPKPCTGEMCSGKSAMPLTPVLPKVHRIGSWAILPVTVRIEAPGEDNSRLIECGVRPIHSPGLIFHPPRLSSSLFTS